MSMQDTLERLRKIRESQGKEPSKTEEKSGKPENEKKYSQEVTSNTDKTSRTLQSPGAVKIQSDLLGEVIWLVFGDCGIDDGLVCYFPEEIEYLKNLPPEEVKRLHKVKRTFPGSRIES